MDLVLQGRYTKQQIMRASFLDQGRASRIAQIAYIVVMALFLVTDVVTAVVGSVDVGTLLAESLPALPMLLLLGGGLWGWPRLQACLIQRSPLFQHRVSGLLSDQDLVLRGGEAESRIAWDRCAGFKMSDDLVLLYADSGAFSTVPREFFSSEDDWQHFRECIRRTVPEKKILSSSVVRWLLFASMLMILAGCAIASIVLDVLAGPMP